MYILEDKSELLTAQPPGFDQFFGLFQRFGALDAIFPIKFKFFGFYFNEFNKILNIKIDILNSLYY